MPKYIVISNHTVEDCQKAIQHFAQNYAGYVTNFAWGCHDHDHNAYAIIEAESPEIARMSVPPLLRDKAKVIQVEYFNPNKMKDESH